MTEEISCNTVNIDTPPIKSQCSPTHSSEAVSHVPQLACSSVLMSSQSMPEGTPSVCGHDFGIAGRDFDSLFASMKYMGFQATNLALAIEEVEKMIKWRCRNEDGVEQRCTIFLGFTSNMISCGVREIIRYLVQNNMVSCIVTTGGAIEEDIMKVFHPHFVGSFQQDGRALRKKGLNRIGNLIVPNNHYCAFEDWFNPLVNIMHDEQTMNGVNWTPSSMIRRLGQEINHESSVLYWAYKNNIDVFCPAITDGAIGDMLYFHSYKRAGFVLDIVADVRRINDLAVRAACTGMLIVGGGLIKHHICNANLMRNGADYSVFINTGNEFDGSDSGAKPDEALSWGKIKLDATPVKVYGEASVFFPLLVAQTFAKLEDVAKRI